ncbi:MAG: FtsX-like permease family protein [Lachnospiraceae bacterium]|jgi:putative ABC transport system permease protein|nr:FtsX-like permease family protein [Lachnospiraceae bacterium]MCI8871785.1 FtsX-like permease family protein [Lachnospiraceae bacterium]MCI9058476.1 FtsX-like permease family protein [Lachnospiraceae bacterium]GFI32778.1 putative ABC transporter permease YknZ [Lachnospiraceae bacterium]
MLENIRLSLQGLWSHKMRSFLTMLGIIIGIAAIIAIVSTIKGTNEQIKENLIGSGDNTVNVQLYQGDNTYEIDYYGVPDGVPVITEETRKQILELDHIENASLYTSRETYNAVYYLNTGMSGGKVCGIDRNYLDTCNYIIKQGRGFTDSDYAKFRKVAVLDENSAETLFQGVDPIGKTVEIQREPFIVIGIIAKSSRFEPVINSIEEYYTYAESSSGAVYVPDATWPILYGYDEPQSLILKLDKVDNMTVAGKEAANILNNGLNVSDDTMKYKAADLLKQAEDIQKLSQSTNTMLIWIAGISLLVGGIGVMNIMLVSVTERTQEIGLKKAIGARKGKILGQFLTEAAVLTSLGGLIGVIVGIVLAEVISKVTSTLVSISVPASILSVVFSMAIGIIFGLLPSYKAANLNPIDALRHE